ncbi:hypothetical protein GCM10010425_16500 [Streptomyces spororaveus]|uniref:Uncharacterized protein n=1 Tax=Streptomyces spororaveus TaxID=284039 RepID=A0ABQ3T9N2_9ACTN|nr:hypothetical protein Sspor_26710 [Streptomyces spororaveus]
MGTRRATPRENPEQVRGRGAGGPIPFRGTTPGGVPEREEVGRAPRSGAAGGRTAARTLSRLGTDAGGVEPRGEECVRGHVPERVSGSRPGSTPAVAARCPPGPALRTRRDLRIRPYATPAGGRKAWLDFMVPQCGRHAFARLGRTVTGAGTGTGMIGRHPDPRGEPRDAYGR